MTGWGTARLSCAPPRSVGLRVDQIAHSDHALGKDPRAAAAVARLRRVEPGTEEVAVALETTPGHRPDGLHGLHRRSGAGGDMERGDASLPHAGILLLFSDLFDQLLVGGALDDLVELGPIVVDEAHASDQDVAGAPALATEDHPVVHGDLAAVLGDDLGLHGGEVAIDLVPEKGDLLTVVELDF